MYHEYWVQLDKLRWTSSKAMYHEYWVQLDKLRRTTRKMAALLTLSWLVIAIMAGYLLLAHR